ncbi:MAG TPA: hypothetical protein DDZ44_10840, partial [Syntrophomonas wolfei]|nr:hypothetical protein [Syntrophomonas wolfei]
VDRVLAYARRKAWDAEIVGELERNLERGKLGCEWWFSQQECLRRIQSARSRAERNYWISMRLLAQASRQGLPNG